ncbi:MAG: hypothetical protein AAF351_01945 [Pseudomonadota bacterium]
MTYYNGETVSCTLCSVHYKMTRQSHESFCQKCMDKLRADEASAAVHVQRIDAGDMRVQPANDRERITRDAARRRQLHHLF